jgi:hypothetical protein
MAELTNKQLLFVKLLSQYQDLAIKAGMQSVRMDLTEGRKTAAKLNRVQDDLIHLVLPELGVASSTVSGL